ncbi:hypothetical protein AB0B07_30335 [Streptomyces sioyaensis]|uniref:hypothetical protein n=1 Tax=Streptomyces sioyaensis TaxID=67364 RepID=UPI0033F8D488
MDAGLAAILGAAGAAAATVTAAIATGAAQRKAARVAATVEQRKKLHESRIRVCTEFIDASNHFYKAIKRVRWNEQTYFTDETRTNVSDALAESYERCNSLLSDMWLAVPSKTFNQAFRIVQLCELLHAHYVYASLAWNMAHPGDQANKKACGRAENTVSELEKDGHRFAKSVKRLLDID